MTTCQRATRRLRLFCALRLPAETVELVAAWQARELRGGRPVPPENLHLTLVFLGALPAAELPALSAALAGAAAGRAGQIRLRACGYRETRSVGMLVFDDEQGRAGALAEALAGSLEALCLYRREARPWSPHLTMLRFRGRAAASAAAARARGGPSVRCRCLQFASASERGAL